MSKPLTPSPFRLALACAMGFALSGCCFIRNQDRLSRFEQAFTSASPAIDCGTVLPGESSELVDDCVRESIRSGDRFIARYRKYSLDSKVLEVKYSDAQGTVACVFYDSAPCGGPCCKDYLEHVKCKE